MATLTMATLTMATLTMATSTMATLAMALVASVKFPAFWYSNVSACYSGKVAWSPLQKNEITGLPFAEGTNAKTRATEASVFKSSPEMWPFKCWLRWYKNLNFFILVLNWCTAWRSHLRGIWSLVKPVWPRRVSVSWLRVTSNQSQRTRKNTFCLSFTPATLRPATPLHAPPRPSSPLGLLCAQGT